MGLPHEQVAKGPQARAAVAVVKQGQARPCRLQARADDAVELDQQPVAHERHDPAPMSHDQGRANPWRLETDLSTAVDQAETRGATMDLRTSGS